MADVKTTDDHETMLRAIGQAVQAASMMENAVRDAFCALVGSKYAAVVAGAISSISTTIDHCQEIIKVHRELDNAAKAALSALLQNCKDASVERNRLIHDMWAIGANNTVTQIQTRRHKMTTRPVTPADIKSTTNKLNTCSTTLTIFLVTNLGPLGGMGAQLRWEEHVASMSPEEREAMERRTQTVAESNFSQEENPH